MFQAQHPDELSIVENEQLEVFSVDSDNYGWSKARNYKGEVGYVPSNYLDIEQETCDPETHDTPTTYQLRSQISFSSVDYMVNDEVTSQTQNCQSDEDVDAEEQSSEKSITTVWEKKDGGNNIIIYFVKRSKLSKMCCSSTDSTILNALTPLS